MRTLVDIPDDRIEALAEISRRENRSRAALVREAVDDLISKRRREAQTAAFGLWKDRDDVGDGLSFQEALRAEWSHRP